MEQIYYTQCPVGYGLGASNGFQVKRITPGYPLASDFRHLGLRAFPAGGRALAPPSLRYRLVDGSAEVAWLTPRPMEYETERGLWGRPGGHFAHGLILTPEELREIDDWPAGLFDAGIWRRSDPEPSRGRTPEPVPLAPEALVARPDFSSVIPIADALGADLLARLLTALAAVAREGRTLFLIDEASRLGPRVALLTYLIPPPLRASITFSTYHDRPEELPGYRIHGTTAASRPNRGLLLTQGIVADLIAGTVEPLPGPSAWAVEVARWVEEGPATGWGDLARRLPAAKRSPSYVPWDDGWLDRLVAFGRVIGREPASADWEAEAELASWAARSDLTSEWAGARGPAWWLRAEVGAEDGRAALLALAGWPATWKRHRPADWGKVVARWFAGAPSAEREAGAVAFAKGTPSGSARFAFIQALRRALPEEAWAGVRQRLDAAFAGDPKTAALWAVPDAVADAVAGRPDAILALAERMDRLGEPAETLLEAARVEARDEPEGVERLGDALAIQFDRPEALRWALRQGGRAVEWLRTHLRHRLALPDDSDGRQSLLDTTPIDLRPALARVALGVASDPGLPDDAFVWGVEDVLLTIPEAHRPAEPGWPGHYLDRSASDLELIGRLYSARNRRPGLSRWLIEAKQAGCLSPSHEGRLTHLDRLARALGSSEWTSLEIVDLSRIPDRDRSRLLSRILRRRPTSPTELFAALDRCGLAWAESFRSGSSELVEIARTVAESEWFRRVDEPSLWFSLLTDFCLRLDRVTPESSRFAAGGFAALVVAYRDNAEGPTPSTWNLRRHLLQNEAGWKTLAEDLRLALSNEDSAASPEIIARWDHEVEQRLRVARFWEIVLNACDGRRLMPVVSTHVEKLRSLGPLAWWDHHLHQDSRDNLRDAFARLIPLAPMTLEPIVQIQIREWLGFEGPPTSAVRDTSIEFNPTKAPTHLSPCGLARWKCIESLTRDVFNPKLDDQDRRFRVRDWCMKIQGLSPDSDREPPYKLSLAEIPVDDRYRLLAWVLFKIEDPSALDIPPVGAWLIGSGVTDLSRIKAWPTELSGLVEVPSRIVRDRDELVNKLREEMRKKMEDLSESKAHTIWVEPDSSPRG